MLVRSLFSDEGKTSLLTNCIVSFDRIAKSWTYDDIGITKTPGDIWNSPEITFVCLNIGISIQAPHGPSLLGLDHL
jgi:hypothetical protein